MNITTSVAPAPPAGPHHLAREALLSVTGLTVTFEPRRHGRIDAPVEAVKGIDFEVHDGQTLAVVGESGSGKSASLLGLVGLLPGNARVAGDVRFAGRDLLGLSESELRAVRGKDIGFVFQDPSSSLHPQKTIGAQLDEILLLHSGLARRARRARVTGLLERVGIAEPQHAYSAYPFEYSGGMKQRAMIAMAIANRPRLIIADEPTTALDATVQASIVELLGDLQREDDTAIVFVNHDLAVVHQIADAVIVMQHGLIVENGPRQDVYGTPGHPYTRRLLAASALHTADAPVAERPFDRLKDPAVELVETTRRPFDRLKDPVDGLTGPADGLGDPVVELVETTRRPFDGLKDPVDGLEGPVDGLKDPVVELVEATRRPFDRLKDPADGLKDPVDGLKDPVVELVETARRPFDRLKDPVDGLGDPVDGLGDPVVELVEATRRPFDGLKDPVDGLEGPVDGLGDPVVELVEATRRPFGRLKDPVDGLEDPVVELVEATRRPFDRLKDPVVELVEATRRPFDRLKDPVVELVEATRRPFDGLKDPVDGLGDPVDGLGDPVVELVEATRRPFDGLKDPVDGLGDPVDGLKDPASGPLLDLRDVTKSYRRRGRHRKPVVDRISLAIGVGELVALVGESGSGKSTIGKIVAGLLYADSGTVRVAGQDYPTAVSEAIPRLTRAQRRSVQMVFQDSYSSLNPRRTVRDSIVAPLVAGRASRAEADTRLREVTDLAGLATDLLDRYPSQLSGGQRQRVAIARALVLDPGLIVADEAISALDVTAQQELIEMIRVLKTESRTSFLFITHDLGVARHLADRVVVLSPDGIQDTGTPAEVFQHPRSAYTRALIDAVPRITTRAS